jgi:hypothetical protein
MGKAPNGKAIIWPKVALATPDFLQDELPNLSERVHIEIKKNATAAGLFFANEFLSKCSPSFWVV